MGEYSQMTDEVVLARLGERLSRFRLDRNLTQADLATEAGVHKNTVFRLEAGGSTQLKNLVRVLRVLGLLDRVEALVPEPTPSPLQQLEALERQRKRAVRRPNPKSGPDPDRGRTEPRDEWSWGEPDGERDADQNPGGGS